MQRVKSTPSLPTSNRFSVLPVDSITGIDESVETVLVVQPPERVRTQRTYRPKWERRLPSKLVIASTEKSTKKSLNIRVSIETTDTGEVKSLSSLVDSGATGKFIGRDYVKANRLTTRTLSVPIPVFNVDGTPNSAGSITEVADLILRYKNHSERSLFAITDLGKEDLILGHTWLKKHNPEIDWATGEVKMSRCPAQCCSGCGDEIKEERKAQKVEARHVARCSAGAVPTFADDSDEYEDELVPLDKVLDFVEGDRVFVTTQPSSVEDIRATSTISQRLAEAFNLNNEAASASAHVLPDYLSDFSSVFSKESFDRLPDPKPWDHAIELVQGEKPSNCKVYPLSPSEQKELDAFIQENLDSGRIRPSKSPMASPVFFIKKKDGSLKGVEGCLLPF